LSIGYYNISKYEKSLEHIIKAIEYNPTDERLLNNKKLIEDKLHKL
jgi:hypothetical protein